jgi:hypothetical protein
VNYPVIGATASYLGAAWMSFRAGNTAWGFMWFGYAFSNVMLMMAEYKK